MKRLGVYRGAPPRSQCTADPSAGHLADRVPGARGHLLAEGLLEVGESGQGHFLKVGAEAANAKGAKNANKKRGSEVDVRK